MIFNRGELPDKVIASPKGVAISFFGIAELVPCFFEEIAELVPNFYVRDRKFLVMTGF